MLEICWQVGVHLFFATLEVYTLADPHRLTLITPVHTVQLDCYILQIKLQFTQPDTYFFFLYWNGSPSLEEVLICFLGINWVNVGLQFSGYNEGHWNVYDS